MQPLATCSSSREPGRPLLNERGNTLRVVGGSAELALRIALDVELLGERVLPTAANRRLGPGEAARQRYGQPFSECVYGRSEFGIPNALPDHSPSGSLLRRELVAEQGQAQRPRI